VNSGRNSSSLSRKFISQGLDREYVDSFSTRVRELYPACPAGRERQIAEHACLKFSGRVGRSASAKALDDRAVRLAVVAHIRHCETQYDDLLAMGEDRLEARATVAVAVDVVLQRWWKGYPVSE
jgi:hypothetical protein